MLTEEIVEKISDDFGSTFTYLSESKMANMLGLPGDFQKVDALIFKYLGKKSTSYVKTGELGHNAEYDIYIITIS